VSRLATFSLRNRALIALVTIIGTFFGLFSLTSLKLELIPSIEFPAMAVVTSDPGSSPEVVDAQVTAPIEAAARTVEGASATTATSTTGQSAVIVELDYGTDLDSARQKLETRLGSTTSGLPDRVEPQVLAGSIADFPVVQLAVATSGDLSKVAASVESDVVPLLSDIEGVRDVTVTGAPTQRVEIVLDPAALAASGAGPDAIVSALTNNGALVPAGAVTEGDRTLSVEVGAQLQDVDDLAALPLLGGDGATIGDVAEVEMADEPITSISRTNGEPSISIGITKTPDGNTVDISHEVNDLFAEIEEAAGQDASVSVVFDQAPFIEKSVEDLTTEGLLGLVFAVIVILVFLLSVRSTLVTALSIPLSLLLTFIGLYVGGYSLNILTLAAVTVAIGRVVDDSIVVIENIKRHLSYGEEKLTAIRTAIGEVAGAVTASTLATVAVFLPIAVVGGQVGELFRPFALTVTLALLASLLVSLTIVPVIASAFLRGPKGEVDPDVVRAEAHEKERRSWLQRAYVPLIGRATGHPVITIVIAFAILFGTFAMAPLLKTSFLGDSGQNTVTVTQELEPGASLAAQDEAASAVESALLDVEGVEDVQTTVGTGEGFAAFAGGGTDASFAVTTDEEADQAALQDEIRDVTDGLEGVGTVAIDASGGFGSAVEVVVTATTSEALDEAAALVQEAVENVDGAKDVTSNAAGTEPTVSVTLDRERAAEAGLDEASLGRALAGVLAPSPLGSVVLGEATQDVVLVAGSAPAGVDALRRAVVPVGGELVPLGEVADVEEVEVPTSVTRQDGERSITVSTTPDSDDLGAVTADLQAALDELDLPDGAEASLGGVASDQTEAFAQLGLALVIAIAIVYVVMVATFRSLLQPLILLVSIPFAATGAIGLLLVTGVPLGVASLIGMLMLIGVVVTNAIVLIDLVNQHREAGESPEVAVVEGARQRLRPILMTAIATIMALTPMGLGITGGSAFISQPLAIVVIGGLISSTLLTLVLVPVLYLQLEKWRTRKERRAAKRAAKAHAATA
jgi:HAE1 family hydrophobic/amphiphilic exporter-1